MRNDWLYSAIRQAEQALSDCRHGTEVAELNQQKWRIANRIASGMDYCIFDVVEREMKVASYGEFYSAADIFQLAQHCFISGAIVEEPFVGMWRCHDVTNPVFRRHAAHFSRSFPGGGAIIDGGEDVAMKVNHLRGRRP